MKKLLICSTAIVAISMIASPVQAAEKIKLGLGGYMTQWVGFAENDYDSDFTTGSGQTSTGFDVQQDAEVHFTGSTTLDNGLTVGVGIEMEIDGTANVDETYMTISSATMGTVQLGGNDSAASAMHIVAPDVGNGLDDGDFGNWVSQPSANTAQYASDSNPGSDAQNITYFSPSFSGFSVGGTYYPDTADEAAAGQSTTADDAWNVAGAYSGTFNDVSVGANVFYGAQNGGDGHSGVDPQGYDEIGGGLSLGFGAITVSGGYKAIDQKKIAGRSSTDGTVWSVGGSYASGPASVSLGWVHGEAEGLVDTVADDELDVIQLSGSYDLGGGVSLLGSIMNVEYDDETTTKTNNNEGWAAVAGVAISF